MTPSAWREHPAAREEYLEALVWYERQDPGLGERLAEDLDSGVDFIRKWPDAAPIYRGRRRVPLIRRKGVEVFPYGIVYFVRDGEVIIIAYAHERRRPGYWRTRLESHRPLDS
ncbi:MAG: type II toxin-antitoxin system RelE/ParE family toxin [Bifidobacteriaceae bacterium]|nr:type II toxin-antitoxin system RelE/ParE family toxin [Bifidobacteriaceae bacterium]